MKTSLLQKKQWNWKYLNTLKSGTTKKTPQRLELPINRRI